MRLALLAITLPLLTTLAHARPITAGLSAGVAQSKQDADVGSDSSHTLGLFGRLGFTPRVAAQLEVSRVDADGYVNIRTVTALVVIDLGNKGRLVPLLVAGLGLDDASTSNDYLDAPSISQGAHHLEAGLGLEYRAAGGLMVGFDLRVGSRTLHTSGQDRPNVDYGMTRPGTLAYLPSSLSEGEYRSARLTVGVQF